MNYYVYIKVKSRSRKVEVIKDLKRWKITSGTRGSPVDDAFCIFLWNSSIKELCCVVRRVGVLRDKLPGATCSVELCARCEVLCDKLRSYAVRSNEGTL